MPKIGGAQGETLKVLLTLYIDLTNDEIKIVRKGERGCSADLSQLRHLAENAADAAIACEAGSWSIFPVPHSNTTYVEFYNWPKYGLCTLNNIYGKYYDPELGTIRPKRLWWDVRPIPEWMSPSDERAVAVKGSFEAES